VWDTCTGALCTTLEGHNNGLDNAIIMPDSTYIVSTDDDGTLILWDWQKAKTLCTNMTMANDHGSFRFLFPYPHVTSSLGFISIHYNTLPENARKHTVCCWVINLSGTSNAEIILVAHGVVDILGSRVLRITHRGSTETLDLTLILECSLGKRFSALWEISAVLDDDLAELQFVEEPQVEELSLKNILVDQPIIYSEVPCRWSDDDAWILDEDNRQILWVPPTSRGSGLWYGLRLVIGGETGHLTLVDFSNVNFNDNDVF
jgi:hypothetical protein